MSTLEQIRKDKYSKLVEKLKERKEKDITKENEEEKIRFVIRKLLTKEAWEYFYSFKEREPQIFLSIGMSIIKTFQLFLPYIDWIIEDIMNGKEIKKVEKIELEKLVRLIKGVRSKIEIVKDGESKTLSETLNEEKKSEDLGRLSEKRSP